MEKNHKYRATIDVYENTHVKEGRMYGLQSGKPVVSSFHADEVFVFGFFNSLGIDGHKINVLLRPFVDYDGYKRLENKSSKQIMEVFNGNPAPLAELIGGKNPLYRKRQKRLRPRVLIPPQTYEKVKFLLRMEKGKNDTPEVYQERLEEINQKRNEVYMELLEILKDDESHGYMRKVKRFQLEELKDVNVEGEDIDT